MIAREKMVQENVRNSQNEFLLERYKKDLDEKYKSELEYKRKIRELERNILRILTNIDRKTEKNTLIDHIMPFLTPIINIVGFFILNKEIKDVKDLSPAQK